jgi:alanine dehydrogenase
VLKWISSFPENLQLGLSTLHGVTLLSGSYAGELRAILDAASLTALRTGAAAVVASETLARAGQGPVGVVGCGKTGEAVARTFVARGRRVVVWDPEVERARALVGALRGWGAVADSLQEIMELPVVSTVTPGRTVVVAEGDLRPGQHLNLMGADGPGKGEIAVRELLRARIVCDEWEQASHSGDLARAVSQRTLGRERVSELGKVLIGTEPGRTSEDDITVFDSTGLAIQDLAIALAVHRKYVAQPEIFGDLQTVDLA